MSFLKNRLRRVQRVRRAMGSMSEYALTATTTQIATAPKAPPTPPPPPPKPLMVNLPHVSRIGARRSMGDYAHQMIAYPRRATPGVMMTATPLAGVSGRPYGAPATQMALGGVPPRWYREQMGSLGDAAPATPDLGTPTLADPQQQMIASLRQIASLQQDQVTKDKWIRYAQIIATLSIPLAAAVWKGIFRAGRGE